MLSPPIIAVDNVSVGYDPKKPVLNRVTLRIDTDDRIALLGSNGNGKSTLVKLLANKLAPFSGHVTRAEKLSVGYFAQHQVDELNLDGSPYDHVRKLMPDAPETKVRGAHRRDRLFRQGRRHPGEEPVGRREGAAAAGTRDLLRPQHDHPRRADQPSGHRQPRGACRSDQRISRRRHHGLA